MARGLGTPNFVTLSSDFFTERKFKVKEGTYKDEYPNKLDGEVIGDEIIVFEKTDVAKSFSMEVAVTSDQKAFIENLNKSAQQFTVNVVWNETLSTPQVTESYMNAYIMETININYGAGGSISLKIRGEIV